MNALIHSAVIFTNDEHNHVLQNHAVAVDGTRICAVGPQTDLEKEYAHFEQIDAAGRLLMPGLINAHMHFYSTFARGLTLKKNPSNFAEILSMLWWKLDSALDSEAVYYSALIPAVSAVKNGVTAVIDHHASPNAVAGSLDRIEDALSAVGLRGVLCYEVSDRDGEEIRERGLDENTRYIKKCQSAKDQNPDHLFDGLVGLHASFTLENETLRQAADLGVSLNRGCHIHVLEDKVDQAITREKFGSGVVERLQEYGILTSQMIAAHGIHLETREMDILARKDAIVVHNPQSNMNNAVGRTNIFELIDKGVMVGIGTDGMSADLKPDVRTSNLVHKHDLRDSNVGWSEIQRMTLKHNPEIFERVSGQKVGRIEPGYLADLILVDYYPPTPLTSETFWGHFLFGIADAVVDTTIINGQIVMQDKRVFGVEEEKLAVEARVVAQRTWKKFYS